MATHFRFAVQATNLDDHETVAAAARQAEDLGYEELYSYDHLGAGDPFLPLMVAAEATSTLRVGTLVINNEFHHPGLLARAVATADRLSGGRMVLGLGTGYARSEHDAMGIEYRKAGARVERLVETLEAMRSLLDTGAAEMRGAFHRLAVEDLGVRPVQDHVPFLVGGNGRQLIQAAGRLADVFQFTGLVHGPDGTPSGAGFGLESILERSRWLTEASRDREATIERSILVQSCVVGSAASAARDRAVQRLGMSREVVESTPFLLFGEEAELVDRLFALRETLDISHVVVRDAAAFAPIVARLAGR